MMKLGKLEQITDLRSVWKHEAKDFTPWLAKEENLEILSEAVGIDIVVEEQESNVGDFSVDLFATEEGTGRRIIIENQLEETNHNHLGKIITYASGKEAEVIIWIVRKARDEHKQAIEWLNQHTDDKFEFFDASSYSHWLSVVYILKGRLLKNLLVFLRKIEDLTFFFIDSLRTEGKEAKTAFLDPDRPRLQR